MAELRHFVRHYWLHALALIVFGVAIVRYLALQDWYGRLTEIALAFGGTVMVVASEEFAEWTGRYGWTRSQWRQQPSWYVKLGGAVLLTWALYRLFN